MMTCNYSKRGIKINHVWFAKEIGDIKKGSAAITFAHGLPQCQTAGFCMIQEQYSLMTNLWEEEEELFKKIRKNFRYEIRRIEKEAITIRVFSSKEMEKENALLHSFADTYNQMYADKGIKATFNLPLINAYIKNNALLFTVAYYNQEPLVFHSYIIDGHQCRFFYSTSPFRAEKELANEIGRMNKALHWHDILWFKKNGYDIYDWGGITNPIEPDGIDNFKLGFGGKLVTYYNIVYGKNIFVNGLLSVYGKFKKNWRNHNENSCNRS